MFPKVDIQLVFSQSSLIILAAFLRPIASNFINLFLSPLLESRVCFSVPHQGVPACPNGVFHCINEFNVQFADEVRKRELLSTNRVKNKRFLNQLSSRH